MLCRMYGKFASALPAKKRRAAIYLQNVEGSVTSYWKPSASLKSKSKGKRAMIENWPL